jgi:cytochrome b6-f complex iron-sulfur subunit
MNRREVVQKFLLGGTVLVLVPSVLESCSKGSTGDPGTNQGGTPPAATKIDLDLSLAENSALNTTGSSKIVSNILIINLGGSFAALSSICTHQGCTVGYNKGAGDIECPCHGSVYSTSGSVINGPAPSALRNYPVTVTGTVLSIAL